jgi:phenylacetate-CoA ligase
MPLAVFRGRPVAADRCGLRHHYDPILRHHYYSAFHLTDDTIPRYLEHIRGIGPCYLHVYPSSAAALARFLRRSNPDPPPNVLGLLAESENVYEDQRALVEQAFRRRLFASYGLTEKVAAAAECEHATDYHVWPTYSFVELLDPDGRPVTTPGDRGEIVGTGFLNTVTPFIRYRTGDHATYVGDSCPACGRSHLLLADIRGHRTQEMLVARDGSLISWTALNPHDDTFHHVRQFQFVQDTRGQARLRLVPGATFTPAHGRRIQDRLDRKLAGRLTIHLEPVDAIRPGPNGKASFVDQRITDATLEHLHRD